MPYRIRDDYPDHELRRAKAKVARKQYVCEMRVEDDWGAVVPCPSVIQPGDGYARLSETNLVVCARHFTAADLVEAPR